MNPPSRHYHQLIGLNRDWIIADVQLDVRNRTLTLPLEFVGDHVVCPECGSACSMRDHATERCWRHLDAIQFQTILTARVPRCSCETCGVKTIAVPWADKHNDSLCCLVPLPEPSSTRGAHGRSAADSPRSGRWLACCRTALIEI